MLAVGCLRNENTSRPSTGNRRAIIGLRHARPGGRLQPRWLCESDTGGGRMGETRVKVLQSVLALGVLAGCGFLVFHYVDSRNIVRRVDTSERPLDEVSRSSEKHGETLARQDKEISVHDQTIRSQ